jgi:hypothetical protein
MSHTHVVVYPPPSPELPYLAALFHNGKLRAARAAPTFEAAESLMATMTGKFTAKIAEIERQRDA